MSKKFEKDFHEYKLINEYPSDDQKKYGYSENVSYKPKAVDWNHHFNILNEYKYGETASPNYNVPKPKKVTQVRKEKITHNEI